MEPERWRQIEALYHAVQGLGTTEREVLLGRADPKVRDKVKELIAQDGSMLDPPDWEGREDLLDTRTILTAGTRLGRTESKSESA